MPEFTGIHSGVGDGYLIVPGSPRETLRKFGHAVHMPAGFARFQLPDEEAIWVNPAAVLFLSDESHDDA